MSPNKIIGIDVGFGYTKAVSEDSLTVFPSLVAKYNPLSFAFNPPSVVYVGGESYVTGESVVECGYSSIPSVRADYFGSNEFFALLASAVAGVVSKEEANTAVKAYIVTGLPPSVFSDSTIKRVKEQALKVELVYESESSKFSIEIQDVLFVPQGLGAYIAYLNDTDGSPDKNTVVIDVGHHTVDFVLIIHGKYAFNKAVSHPIGVKIFFDSIKEGIAKKYGFIVSDEAVKRVIKKGHFTHFGVTYSYNCSTELKNYKDLLIGYMKNYAEEVNVVVDEVILAGGGSLFLNSAFSGIQIVNYPQIANAKGYFIYGRKVFR